jgi:hypothetical protein
VDPASRPPSTWSQLLSPSSAYTPECFFAATLHRTVPISICATGHGNNGTSKNPLHPWPLAVSFASNSKNASENNLSLRVVEPQGPGFNIVFKLIIIAIIVTIRLRRVCFGTGGMVEDDLATTEPLGQDSVDDIAALTSPVERLFRYLGYARITSADILQDYCMWGNVLYTVGSIGYLACDATRGVSSTH